MRKFFSVILFLIVFTQIGKAQLSSAQIDSLTQAVIQTFDVPGIAVGVVKDGRLIHAKGYGVRSLQTRQPVDDYTLFGIASNSKAFTAAAIAILVDEKKMNWNDPVQKYLPDFKLYSPEVSAEFTVRDLLCHRSGLGLGAGDLMFFPEGGSIGVDTLIHHLRYLKKESSFRSEFQYNNLMFITAGEVIKKVSGLSWNDFVEQRILKPLQMTQTASSYGRIKNNTNVAAAHAPVNGKAVAVPHDWSPIADAAGGIVSNIVDISKWVITQINGGKYGDSNQNTLFSKDRQVDMWNLQTSIGTYPGGPYNTHFSGYGLGWFVSDVSGKFQAGHTGGLIGMTTQITIIPELKLGIIVLTNQQNGFAFSTITNSIKDSYLGFGNRKWLERYSKYNTDRWKEANQITDSVYKQVATAQTMKPPYTSKVLEGTYHDDWMGNIAIDEVNGKLRIQFENSPRLKGDLLSLNHNTYVAKWDDRTYDADAYVTFIFDETDKPTDIQLKAISPMTDFSFDFQDLHPKKIK